MAEFYHWLQAVFASQPLWFVFFSGFFSATLLPGSSEVSVYAALSLQRFGWPHIVLIATLGNTLGGMTNYALGRLLPNRASKQVQQQRVLAWIERYGYWALLMSWMPIVGDPLCVVAGWLRMNVWFSCLAIGIGKGLRYAFIALVFQGLL
ncbi:MULTISPECIES: YqaA family protein [Vibrio]|uniref:DedA family protein n=1 Tax=Vibrio algicola TaxID=2662262 RepID=A0A5Q0TE85_9VIBR|nr:MULTISPECIES: YqaA family protein [Vibrio]MBD1576075.1 DedA family protein [Vibrio sp. S11_S32]